jgi:sec-independent protein translocase protein TatC
MRQRPKDDLFQESTMTFGEHLEELRACLFKSVLGLVIGACIGLALGQPVMRFIQFPLESALQKFYAEKTAEKVQKELDQLRKAGYALPGDLAGIAKFIAEKNLTFEQVYINPKELSHRLDERKGDEPLVVAQPPSGQFNSKELVPVFIWRRLADDPHLHATSYSTQEAFMIYMKASLLVGVVLASPWIFYQIWSFVAAGLYPNERRYVHVFLPFSLLLFLSGASLAFFFVFERVLLFLFSFNTWLGIELQPRISEWMGFVLLLPLGFGASFQLPLVMLFMERIGVIDVRGYLSSWRIAVLAIFVLAMVLTPSGDPYSMLLMAGPLVALYFGGIVLCRFMPRHRG